MYYDEWFINDDLPKPFSQNETNEYFEKMALGDSNARDKIIEHNLRLVAYIVQRFSNTYHDSQELMSVGTFGLMKGVDTFDVSKEIKFATYASRCIENEILMFLRRTKKYMNDLSLEEPLSVDNDGHTFTVEDFFPDENSDFVTDYENKEIYKIIREVVSSLPPRDKEIICKRFGFENEKITSQKELAQELEISQSYISRLEKKIIKRLEKQLVNKDLIEIHQKLDSKTPIGENNTFERTENSAVMETSNSRATNTPVMHSIIKAADGSIKKEEKVETAVKVKRTIKKTDEIPSLISKTTENTSDNLKAFNTQSMPKTMSKEEHQSKSKNKDTKNKKNFDKNKSLDNIQEPFFSIYENYNQLQVIWAILKSTQTNRNILFLRHGENLSEVKPWIQDPNKSKSYNSVTYIMAKKEIREILEGKKKKQSFIEKYKKEEFESILSILTPEELHIFKLFHGENYNEHCLIPYDEEHTIFYYYNQYLTIINKLENNLKLKDKDQKKKLKLEKKPKLEKKSKLKQSEKPEQSFFSQFEEYIKTKILWALLNCGSTERNAVFLKFGPNLTEWNELSQDSNHSKNYYYSIISRNKKNIIKMLEDKKQSQTFIEKYKKEEFEPILSTLTPDELHIFKLFHGENYNEHLLIQYNENQTIQSLCELYLEIIDKIENSIKLYRNKNKKKNEKQINKSLTENEYQILELRYGIKDGQRRTQTEVAKIFNCCATNIHYKEKNAIEKLRNNPDLWLDWNSDKEKLDLILNSKTKKRTNKKQQETISITKEESLSENNAASYNNGNTKFEEPAKYEYLADAFAAKMGCSLEVLQETISTLSKEDQEIIYLRRGRDLKEMNEFPKDKELAIYVAKYSKAIGHLTEKLAEKKPEERKVEEVKEQIETKKRNVETKEIIQTNSEKKEKLIEEKLQLLKSNLFLEITKLYGTILKANELETILNEVVIDAKISKNEYLYKIDRYIFMYIKKQSDEYSEKVIQMFSNKMKFKYPLLSKEKIESIILETLRNYNGETKFETELYLTIKKINA